MRLRDSGDCDDATGRMGLVEASGRLVARPAAPAPDGRKPRAAPVAPARSAEDRPMTDRDESVTKQMGLDSYCSVCGTPLPPRASTGRPRRTCSDRCRQRRRRDSMSTRRPAVTKPAPAAIGTRGFVTSPATCQSRVFTPSRRLLLRTIEAVPGQTIPELAAEFDCPQNPALPGAAGPYAGGSGHEAGPGLVSGGIVTLLSRTDTIYASRGLGVHKRHYSACSGGVW